MRKKLLVAATALLGTLTLVLVGAMIFVSPEWEVSRSRVVQAPNTRVHATVADLHGWPDWTAWKREGDPEATWSFEGAPAGAGAVMRWNGPRFGQGRLTLVRADPATGVEYEMVMESNEDMTIEGTIRYEPVEGGTRVTWTDRGSLGWNPILRLFKPIATGTLGGMLEQGLEGLAERVETKGR